MLCLPAPKLSAQFTEANTAEPLQVVFGEGEQIEGGLPSRNGVVDPVSLKPNQVMAFILRFPVSKAGQPIVVGALDGGEVTAAPGAGDVVANDGTARFSFQTDQTAGLYRVVVQLPGEQHLLQFYLKR